MVNHDSYKMYWPFWGGRDAIWNHSVCVDICMYSYIQCIFSNMKSLWKSWWISLKNKISLGQSWIFWKSWFFFSSVMENLVLYTHDIFSHSLERVILFEAFLRPDLHCLQALLHWILGGGGKSFSRPLCPCGFQKGGKSEPDNACLDSGHNDWKD